MPIGHWHHRPVCCDMQVSAEALRVTEQMIHIIRPDPGKAVPSKLKVPSREPETTSALSSSVDNLLRWRCQQRRTSATSLAKHSQNNESVPQCPYSLGSIALRLCRRT